MASPLEVDGELVAVVREFAQREVAPRVRDYDREEVLPRDLLEKMAALDFFGGTVPTEWGGAGLDHVTFVAMIEEMSRVDHNLGVLMSMPSGLVGSSILQYGSDEQKTRWLMPLARGKIFGAAGVTEPGSGTDVAGMQTTYERDDDSYVINGAKAWISNLDIASFFVTFASMDRSLRHAGITSFIIPADTPGVVTTPFKNKLGFRPLCTGELALQDVRVGGECVLGNEGEGFAVAMTAVERGRLAVGARAVGLAQACLDDSIEYAKNRYAFGRPISEFQMVQKKIADMATGVASARLLVRHCAQVLDSGLRSRLETSMAKMYATDVALQAATEAVQIHGAYGVSDECRAGRFYRDAKIFQIVEGVNDIHRVLIAKILLGLHGDSKKPFHGDGN